MAQTKVFCVLIVLLFLNSSEQAGESLLRSGWKAHDLDRPRPPQLTPPEQNLPVPPPTDALVLFDGSDLSKWESPDGSAAKWIVSEGAMISVAGSGYLQTRERFGDVQLHVEWATPLPVKGKGQGRGNSGVYLMGRYEVQVLDSFQNPTYADGQAGAIYGQYPPLYNVSLPPGKWQSYDIFFRSPRFSEGGALLEPARVTLLHNGVLVQNNVELWGATNWLQSLPYQSHADELPLALQDHGNPVRFRNIWLRKMPDTKEQPSSASSGNEIDLPPSVLDRYVGRYETEDGDVYTLRRDGHDLRVHFQGGQFLELVCESPIRFVLKRTAAALEFELDEHQVPTGLIFHIGEEARKARKVP